MKNYLIIQTVLYNYYNNSLYQTGGVAPAVAAVVAGPAVKAALANPGATMAAAQAVTSGKPGFGKRMATKKIGDKASKIKQGASEKASKAGKAIKDAPGNAKKVKEKASKAGKAIKDAPGKAKEKAKQAGKAVGKAAFKGAMKGLARRNNESDTDEMIDMLKTFLKVIIFILILVCIPIVPWILISFYAFQNLSKFIRANMMNL